MIAVQCPACKMELGVPDRSVGKSIKCPGCRKSFDVPDRGKNKKRKSSTAWAAQTKKHKTFALACPACASRMRLPVYAQGHMARCPACEVPFRVPGESRAATPVSLSDQEAAPAQGGGFAFDGIARREFAIDDSDLPLPSRVRAKERQRQLISDSVTGSGAGNGAEKRTSGPDDVYDPTDIPEPEVNTGDTSISEPVEDESTPKVAKSEIIVFDCPGCNLQLNVPAEKSGAVATCPKCSKRIRVPDREEILEEAAVSWLDVGGEDFEDDITPEELASEREYYQSPDEPVADDDVEDVDDSPVKDEEQDEFGGLLPAESVIPDIVTIPCRKCDMRLDVPTNAVGKVASCPGCSHKFKVPAVAVLLEESAALWISDESADEEDATDDSPHASKPASAVPDQSKPATNVAKKSQAKPGKSKPSQAAGKPKKPESQKTADDADSDVIPLDLEVDQSPAATSAQKSKKPVADLSDVDVIPLDDGMEPESVVSEPSDTASKKPEDKPAAKAVEEPRPSARSPERSEPIPDVKPRRKSEPQDAGDQFRDTQLVIEDMFGEHIVFSFSSFNLSNDAFRASMPFRCMHTNELDHHLLVARPMAWANLLEGIDPDEFEGRNQLHVRSFKRPSKVVQAMPPSPELREPFNELMPYFVSEECIGKESLRCETKPSKAGIRCWVTIPCLLYGLDWMARVNGVCGDDFVELEEYVFAHEGNAEWQALKSKVRERLGAWFENKPGEQFVAYFKDSDITKADSGTAGLILTTLRIAYSKFHRHGEIPIGESAELIAVPRSPHYELVCRRGKDQKRIMNITKADIDDLRAALAKLDTKIKVTVKS